MNNLNVLYEDNHIIVVEKKSGILSQKDNTGDESLLDIVKDYVKEKYQKPGNVYIGLVHRLDRNVGGIMVFARTSKAAKRLNEQIKNNDMKKTYLALLNGKVIPKKDKIVNYIFKDEKQKKSFIVDKNNKLAKEAKLEYELIKYIENRSLVKINLITGRFHQIRVQFSNKGYPLIGDIKYGGVKSDTFYLHAYKLEFYHPVTKEKLEFKLLPRWKEINDETIIY